MIRQFASLCLLFGTAWTTIPQHNGYNVVFSDDFNGDQGSAVDGSKWDHHVPNKNNNDEVQHYTYGTDNAHLSGDGQLYIIPKKKGNDWYSAKLLSVGKWTPGAGKALLFEAEIWVPNFTGSPDKFAGLWPAFWAKGNSDRISNPVKWPKNGEWDILEVTNKMSNQNQATLHFIDASGQHNGAFNGRVTYTGGKYHTWAVKVDRRKDDWKAQTLTWYLDGNQFYQVTGAMIGTLDQWKELAWSPFYIVLNVALGGGYAGNPTENTISGYDASMRVRYVGVYETV
ncbi:glycoside hydrolase family 16 protein [Lasiosphaeris hirsuta]|uniref:Glycoside hydrolase family 16 protein n=1 Tax=Lasiosphaeris hirsuta TaxID=260670 RepID=A0AA40DUF7_9PEZI|nr:glycoside hydrolase family 16 protein [Lasiosphaeris hirsuta]